VGLIDQLPPGPIGIDTAPFIYFVERHPRYVDAIRPLIRAADAGTRQLVTSAITLLEVLVVPYRAGDLALASEYETLLTRSRGLRVCDIDAQQLRAAAQLRAKYGLRTPDSIQLAAAITSGCAAFVTNDRRIPDVDNLKIVLLDSVI
jgi:predicted nucleic acid-binding protein